MKNRLIVALTAAVFLLSVPRGFSAEKSELSTELKDLVSKVQNKLKAGQKSEQDLAEELKAFDALLAKHKDEKTDEIAQVLFMKAMLYMEVLDDSVKGEELIQKLK